ncbi:45633_t:CDS:2 [Gigaspora margarita]|uniref:45633_t:CDS:1 n=1 Tax=Gigaspora margarita TaxID=4874 RepID=A0ABN7W640_GIGMA|nr:45633_t:CDS:2 [Gigaspora margarita]
MSYSFQKNFQDIILKIADLGLSVPRPTMENVVDVLMKWNHVDIIDNESSIYKEFIKSEKIMENDANLDQNIQDESVSAIYANSALSQYITCAFEIDTTNF